MKMYTTEEVVAVLWPGEKYTESIRAALWKYRRSLEMEVKKVKGKLAFTEEQKETLVRYKQSLRSYNKTGEHSKTDGTHKKKKVKSNSGRVGAPYYWNQWGSLTRITP